MSNFSPTVQTVLQIMSDLRGESSTNTDATRIRAISRAAKDLSLRRRWHLFLLPDQTATGDGTTSALTIGTTSFPCRPKGLSEIFVGGITEDKRYLIKEFYDFKKLVNTDNSTQVVYQYYDKTTDTMKVKINPLPALSSVITYSYYFQHPDVALVTDLVYCQDPIVIAKLALADLYHGEDELQKEIQQRQEAEQIIEEYTGYENEPNTNELLTMPAIENSISNKGIGSY